MTDRPAAADAGTKVEPNPVSDPDALTVAPDHVVDALDLVSFCAAVEDGIENPGGAGSVADSFPARFSLWDRPPARFPPPLGPCAGDSALMAIDGEGDYSSSSPNSSPCAW
jgi:hypothetical protein